MSGQPVIERLLERVPAFRAEWDRDQAFYEAHKEIESVEPPTPTRFLIGIAFTRIRGWAQGDAEATDQLRALFAFLEAEAVLAADDGNSNAEELLDRFVRFLPQLGDRDAEVLELLGPTLRELKDDELRYDASLASEGELTFVDRMLAEVPFLRAKVLDHLTTYRHPLIHIFLGGTVVPQACGLYAAGHADLVRPLLEFLDREFDRDDRVENAVAVSFVEMLPDPGNPGSELEQGLGPKLRAELARQRAWTAARARECQANEPK
jgi:hypothetical protein